MNHLIVKILISVMLSLSLIQCSSSVTDPQSSTGLLGDDYFGETILPDEEDLAPPGLSLLNFKGGEFIRSGSDQEIRWILKPEKPSDYGLFSSRVEYSDDMGATWKEVPGAVRIPALSGSPVSYIWRIPEISGGSNFLLKVTIKNVSGEERTTQSDSPFTLDNEPPVIKESSLIVNSNQPIKKSYFNYSVGFVDSTSPIPFVCSKNLNKTSQEAIIPDQSDPCWKKVSEFGKTADKNLNLENIFFIVGFLPGEYVFRVWAKDQAGNISVLRSGLGEAGVDKKEYTYNPAKAIQFQKVLFANTNNPDSPPTAAEQDFSGNGANVFINYKTDDVPVSKEISVSLNGGETYGAPLAATSCSPKTGYDFCFQIPYQSTLDFQVRIRVVSALGMVSSAVSPPLNANKFRLIAGNLDSGIGGSATTAGYKPNGDSSIAIDSKSRAYINDNKKGILLLNPDDGSVNVFLKKDVTKASVGEGVHVSVATTSGIYSLAIDYKDRLLLVEADRIRRIETDGTISTLIGGYQGKQGMNFFPIQGCMRSTNGDLKSISAYGPYVSYAQNPTLYYDTNFVTEAALYRVNSTNGSILLNNIDKQNYDNVAVPGYVIKKENIFYESEFLNLKMDFVSSGSCGFNRKPTITPLPNGDIYFEGFHSREINLGRGNYIKAANRAAGPAWYGYYSAPTATKKAEVRLIPLKGAGSLNYKTSGDLSKGLGTLFLNQTFESSILLSNLQISFNYQTNKLLNLHSRGCIHYNNLCQEYYLSMNYSPKSGNSVGGGIQYIPELWWEGGRLITSRKGELYDMNRNNMGLYKYIPSSNKFERILGTGALGQCEDGSRALECAVDIQDAFIDDKDNVYFFDRDRLRVLVKKSANYKDSIVVTLFGFSKSQGDYDPAEPLLGDSLAARFNNIRSVSLHSFDKKLIVHDSSEAVVREFSMDPADALKYKMKRIAGNVYKTNFTTYNGSLISNEFATDSYLNFNSGVYADASGNVYSRAGRNVFSKLNRTGPNKDKWEVILGNPAGTPAKKIWEINSNSCDAATLSPIACDASDRSYDIQGILPIEGAANPFLMFSTWTWYQYDRQGGLKLTKTTPDGASLVRNLTMGDWFTGLKYTYGLDGSVLSGTTNFGRYAAKAQYQDVGGTGYIFTAANESWLNEPRIRYLSLVRNASQVVTSGGKVGTLIAGLDGQTMRSFYVIYDPVKNPQFEAYVCSVNGKLLKYKFNNNMTSHTGVASQATNVTAATIKLPTGYTCMGLSIEYSASEKKLYFPVQYDGNMGVGELNLL